MFYIDLEGGLAKLEVIPAWALLQCTAIGCICIGTILPAIYLVSGNLWWGVGRFAEAALVWKKIRK